jgi:hypothetical protein
MSVAIFLEVNRVPFIVMEQVTVLFAWNERP